jgi:signal transduction histidine kinase
MSEAALAVQQTGAALVRLDDLLPGAEHLPNAAWVFDIARARMVWANGRALGLWNAGSLAELTARDLGREMSESVRTRLASYLDRFAAGDQVVEQWTFYPLGRPCTVVCYCAGVVLPDGRPAMLVQAHPTRHADDPTLLRAVEALRHTSVMIATYRRGGEVLTRNPASLRAFPAPGHRFADRFARPGDAAGAAAALDRGEVFSAVVPVETAEGRRWHGLDARITRDPVTGADVVLVNERDVTQQHAAEEAMMRAMHAAEEASRAKSRFLASMSHELRTPLNAIIGFSEIIRDRIHGDDQLDRYCEYAGDIHDSGRHLLRLINDILDLSKIEAGKLELALQPVRVPDLLADAARLLRMRARRRGIALIVEAPADLPLIKADELRLRQIVINLLSNAIRFSGKGNSIRLAAEAAGHGAVTILVADTGVGIPPDQIERVVQPFEQYQCRGEARGSGTGLGLSLARDLAELHGGRLDIESAVDVGTTVRVTLPRTPPGRH